MKEYGKMFHQMFQFDGRTRRREYWVCTLINSIISSVLVIMMLVGATIAKNPLFARTSGNISFDTKESMIATLFVVLIIFVELFFSIAMFGMKVRRFHDAGVPGWVYPICLVGYVLCGLGLLAEFIICVLPSKPDNKYGENPKKPELDEYKGGAIIVVVLIAFFFVNILAGIAAVVNIGVCGYRTSLTYDSNSNSNGSNGNNGSNGIGDSSSADTSTQDDISDMLEDDSDGTIDSDLGINDDGDISGSRDGELTDSDDAVVSDDGDSDVDSGDGVPSDSKAFHLTVGNVNLTLTFDPGATVEESDYSIKLTRTYSNGKHFNIEYSDSFYGESDLDSLFSFDFYGGLSGYTLVDSAEKKKLADGHSYVSYYIYKTDDGSIIANATIWEYVGGENFMEIKVDTDATDDINKIIDNAYVSFN